MVCGCCPITPTGLAVNQATKKLNNSPTAQVKPISTAILFCFEFNFDYLLENVYLVRSMS